AGVLSLTFPPGPLLPLLLTVLTAVLLLGFPHAIRNRWPGILLGTIMLLGAVGPQVLIYDAGRANPFGRIEQFPWISAGRVDTRLLVETLTQGVPRAFGSFWDIPDSSTQYGGQVAFFPPVAVLLAVGAVAAIARPFPVSEIWVLLWWTMIVFVGGALTRDPPFWPRLVMSLIPAMIIVGEVIASLIAGVTLGPGGRGVRLVAGVVGGALLRADAAGGIQVYPRSVLWGLLFGGRPTP